MHSPSIYNAMADRKQATQVTAISGVLVFCIYTAVMLAGYAAYAQYAQAPGKSTVILVHRQ